jgi:phenylalanyl-tRNA synthetase alpha chain
MQKVLNNIKNQTLNNIEKAVSLKELEDIKVAILGKKGQLTVALKNLSSLAINERPVIGKLANEIKLVILNKIKEKSDYLNDLELRDMLTKECFDATLPAKKYSQGNLHPLSQTMVRIEEIFYRLGFSKKQGPDIESEYYNFEALNIPSDHAARDMHDTFYLTNGYVLRTHTSPVQIRVMERQAPPVKIIVPGKVYRCDADVSHSPVFHQIEGLYVDEQVSFADLKGILEYFLHALFGASKKVRFRPSYFPFTEPSTEIDIECVHCVGKGCNVCKQTGWIEILGAGMVNRNVFRYVNYNVDEFTGFAFGMGIERIAMLLYEINDIRLFYDNDIRFLKQF